MHPIILPLVFLITFTTAQDVTIQDLGNPALLANYPPCSPECFLEVVNGPSNPCAFTTIANRTCQCDSGNRAATAACEKISCSPADFNKTFSLAQQICQPFYVNGTINSTLVSAAIAASTSSALAAVSGKDPTNPEHYPLCAGTCLSAIVPESDCGRLSSSSCVCNSSALRHDLVDCEKRNCGPVDLQRTLYLGYKLCAPPGSGDVNASVSGGANQTFGTASGGSVRPGPTGIVPFTGAATFGPRVKAGRSVLFGVVSAVLVFIVG